MFTTDLVNLYNMNFFKTSLYIYIFQDEKCRLIHNLYLSMVCVHISHVHWTFKRCYVLFQGFFPSGNFSMVFFQETTSQKCNFPSGNFPSLSQPQHSAPILFQSRRSASSPSQPQRSAPHSNLRRLTGHNLTFGKLPLGKLHTLGRCHLGKCLFEST